MSSLYKLTTEEKEAVIEMVTSDAFKILCDKIIPSIINRKQTRAFSLSIANESDLLILAVEKSKVEGSQELFNEIASIKQSLFAERSKHK